MDDILAGFAFMLVVLGQCLAVIAVQCARHEDRAAHRSGSHAGGLSGAERAALPIVATVAALNLAGPAAADQALQSTMPQSATTFEIPLNSGGEEASAS